MLSSPSSWGGAEPPAEPADGDAGVEGDSGEEGDAASDGGGDVGEDSSQDVGPVSEVSFVSPADGAVVENPVTFEVEAQGVNTVQIEADEWPLAEEPWEPEESATLTYGFSGTGFKREVVLLGYGDDGEELDRDTIFITVEEPSVEGPGETSDSPTMSKI